MSRALWSVAIKVTLATFFAETPHHHSVALQPLHAFLKSSRLHSHSLLLTTSRQTIPDEIGRSVRTLSVTTKGFLLYMFSFVSVRFMIKDPDDFDAGVEVLPGCFCLMPVVLNSPG